MTYKGSSDAQRKAVAKYQSEKVQDIKVRVKRDDKHNRDYYKKQSQKLKYDSLNDFIVSLMDYAIKNKLTANKVKSSIDDSAK